MAILPYLGFPNFWKNVLFSITGLGLIYFSYVLYKEWKLGEAKDKSYENFSENENFSEEFKGENNNL